MAQNAYLFLQIDGSDVDTQTFIDSSTETVAGVDVSTAIEVTHFVAGMSMGTQLTHGSRGTSDMNIRPAQFTAGFGKATAHIAQALYRNQRIDLQLKLFSRDPDTGALEHDSTYGLTQGRIVGFELENPDTLNTETASCPSLCRFEVTGHGFSFESVKTGSMCEFVWTDRS